MRVRFAPSPTGLLHFGTMRTAVFGWLCARGTKGQFILRIEDTDQERYIPGSEAQIFECLTWLGLDWDEGPEVGGKHEPYVQSERLDLYRQAAETLASGGHAYWCTCTPQRLEQMREKQREAHLPTRYDRHCLARQDEVNAERAAGQPAVLRQRIPEGRCEWDDIVGGHLGFEYADIDDSVLLKSDGFPTYHLAVVVDDHDMEISHVIRGTEWIPSTPKHIALYSALGWTPPLFAHVPHVLGEDGKTKLSKRHGARFILEYGELGYLPQALLNTMALLGWGPPDGEEFMTMDDLIAKFTLDRVHNSPAIFDPKRLDDFNGRHIRALPDEELIELLEYNLPGTSKVTRGELIPMLRERMVTLADATVLAAPLLGEPEKNTSYEFPPKKVSAEVAGGLLTECIKLVKAGGLKDTTELRMKLTAWLEERNVKARDGFRVLYIAILGRPIGVPVFDAMAFIEEEKTISRCQAAVQKLGTPTRQLGR
jgi:glutamyl-tRNA synthetase